MVPVRLRAPLTVWLYPADSIVGGSIEERDIIEVQEHKVLYDKCDEEGMIGAKRSCVFFTKEQAELARDRDKRLQWARHHLEDMSRRTKEAYDD